MQGLETRMWFKKNQKVCYKKLFGNRFRVRRSKIDFCESDLKNKWPNINYNSPYVQLIQSRVTYETDSYLPVGLNRLTWTSKCIHELPEYWSTFRINLISCKSYLCINSFLYYKIILMILLKLILIKISYN